MVNEYFVVYVDEYDGAICYEGFSTLAKATEFMSTLWYAGCEDFPFPYIVDANDPECYSEPF